jgi:site-specific recombinase XerD
MVVLIAVRKQIGKPFRNTTKDDIRAILKSMEQKGYKASTNEKCRQVLKLFFKVVYGNNEFYPQQVKWFSSKLGKEKAGKDTAMDMAEYLEEEEVQKLIENADTLQNKSFLACLYESGVRPEEFKTYQFGCEIGLQTCRMYGKGEDRRKKGKDNSLCKPATEMVRSTSSKTSKLLSSVGK